MGIEINDNHEDSKPYPLLRKMQIKAMHYHLSPIAYQNAKDQNSCFNILPISV